MDDVDLDALERQLGEQAVVDARTLAELERALDETGYLKRGSDGQLQALAQGDAPARQGAAEGRRARGCRGVRASATCANAGAAGELTGASREWEFGDTEPWDVTRTVTNAVVRTAGERRRRAPGVRLDVT